MKVPRTRSGISARCAAILVATMVFQVFGASAALAAAPAVKHASIAPGEDGVSVSPELRLEYEAPITFDGGAGSITWAPDSGEIVEGYASVSDSVYLIVGPSSSPIQYDTNYLLTIPANMVLDATTDEPMSSDYTLAFRTQADSTGPTFYSASIRADVLSLKYCDSESGMDVSSVPTSTDFCVTFSGSVVAVTEVAAHMEGSLGVYVLTLAAPVSHDVLTADILLSYTPGTNPIVNAAGISSGALTTIEVTNKTPEDLEPPQLLFAIVPEGSSDTVQAVFSENLLGSGNGGFVLTVDGVEATLSSVDSAGRGVVDLKLSSSIDCESIIGLAYDGTGTAQDPFGNLLLPFTPQPVENYGAGYERPVAQVFPSTVRSTPPELSMTLVLTGADFGCPDDAFVRIDGPGYSGATTINSYVSDRIVFTTSGLNPVSPTTYSAEVGRQFETTGGEQVNTPVATAAFIVGPDVNPIQISNPVLSAMEDLPEVNLVWTPAIVYGGSADDVVYRLYRSLNPKSEAEDPGGEYWDSGVVLSDGSATSYTDDLSAAYLDYAQVEYFVVAAYQGSAPAGSSNSVSLVLDGGSGDPVPVSSVDIGESSLSLTAGQPAVQLAATVLPPTATNKAVTWESSNTSVASVVGAGQVLAVGEGTCSITVRTEDGGFTDSCEITVSAPTGGGAIAFEWTDDDTDHVYYSGDNISFTVTGLDSLPDATPVRVTLGLLGEQGFDTSNPVVEDMLDGGPYFYLQATVSGGEIQVSGVVETGLSLGVLGCQVGTSSDGGVTWTALAPAMAVDPPGDNNTGLIEVNVPDTSVIVAPALRTIQNLYDTEVPLKFTKMMDIGQGLEEFGGIRFRAGLNLINGKDQFDELDNPERLTMLGRTNGLTGEGQYCMGVDTSTLAFLASHGATVTIAALPAGFENVIVTNLDDATGVATNIVIENGILSFDVNHFSTYVVDGAVTPVWPQGSRLAALDVQSSGLTLNWTHASDNVTVTQYKIYRASNLIQTVSGQVLSVAVSGLAADTQHTFKVEAGDAAGAWTTTGPSVTVITASQQSGEPDDDDISQSPSSSPLPDVKIEQGKADVSASASTTRTTASDGRQGVNMLVGQAAISAALENPTVKEVVVKITEAAQDTAVTVPGDSLTDMSDRQASLVVQTVGANLCIPVQAMNARALSDLLDAPANQIQVKVSVQEVSPEVAQVMKSQIAILDENLRPVGNILDLSIRATAGDKSVSIDSFTGAEVTGEIPFSAESVAGMDVKKLCVYRFNESTDTWEPVRSKVDVDNGKVIFYTDHFSKYTLMALDKTFLDMDGHWAKEDIELLTSRWVVQGDSATAFAPERYVTRAEFAAMMARAIGLSATRAEDATFTDVDPFSWYFAAVSASARAGLVTGVGEGRFEPDLAITREETAAIVMRALSAAGVTVGLSTGETEQILSTFYDRSSVYAWSADHLAGAVKAGIVHGMGGELRPGAPATRAQAAVMVRRLMSLAGLL